MFEPRTIEPTTGGDRDAQALSETEEQEERELLEAVQLLLSIDRPSVTEELKGLLKISLSSIVSKTTDSIRSLQQQVAEMVPTEQPTPSRVVLARQAQRQTLEEQAISTRLELEQGAQESKQKAAAYISARVNADEIDRALWTRPALAKLLDEEHLTLLSTIEQTGTYFRAETLAGEQLSLIRAEEGIRLLNALGLVRPVIVQGQECYRLVVRQFEQAPPEGLSDEAA